jgi:hypothetical protein
MDSKPTGTNCWKATIELCSPMQIGAGTLGFVEKTELFVPPRVLWGAFTAAMTRKLCGSMGDDYKEIGALLGGSTPEKCFSTFFPSEDSGATFWIPRYNNGERYWYRHSDYKTLFPEEKPRSEAEMRSRLVTGITGQATDPERMATTHNTLHETDLIKHRVRDKEDQPGRFSLITICFTGFLALPETIGLNGKSMRFDENNLKDLINSLRLGGGRKRGHGIIKCFSGPLIVNPGITNFAEIEHPDPAMNEKKILLTPNHKVVSTKGNIVDGRAFLAVYRQYDNTVKNKGYGRDFSEGDLCWEVGCVIETEKTLA